MKDILKTINQIQNDQKFEIKKVKVELYYLTDEFSKENLVKLHKHIELKKAIPVIGIISDEVYVITKNNTQFSCISGKEDGCKPTNVANYVLYLAAYVEKMFPSEKNNPIYIIVFKGSSSNAEVSLKLKPKSIDLEVKENYSL